MKRLVTAYSPSGSPVKILRLVCDFKPQKHPTTLAPAGRKEGVHTSVEFAVVRNPASSDEIRNDSPDFEVETSEAVVKNSGPDGVEGVEFTFALYDVFDNFLTCVQGLAGPGTYRVNKKRHKAMWVFEIDGAFSQYHALCFPSQARLMDGDIWRCDRQEVVKWLNEQMSESGTVVTVEDIFMDGGMREGVSE